MYRTNFHFKSFSRCAYTAFLALEHSVLAMEVSELCGLFCHVQEFILSSLPEYQYIKVMVILHFFALYIVI